MSQGGEAYRLWLLWFHFLFWQPPALLWLFTGEYAYHFFSFTFYLFHFHFLFWQPPSLTIHGWISLSCLFCSLCRVYLFWLHRQCFYCPWRFFQTKNNTHTDEISQLCWHENLSIFISVISSCYFFNEKFSLIAIIFSNLLCLSIVKLTQTKHHSCFVMKTFNSVTVGNFLSLLILNDDF